ncbi:uncharacterized protein KY384_000285 [Bacidia gigantensis]|uniref:uncharacterized protein n=1 Tax=Bacidia gigantensis TaxID=2732470 RepID=UPI001D035F30|nr:uncharacterized protein KY384_000285 [Bacidia gigantensis]KAG8526292.1 hypothetical protein KY384_000285 [Bacidia gigantensis]
MSSPDLSLSPTPDLPDADHNDATEHPLEDLQDDPTVQAADPDATKDDDNSDNESILSDVDEAQFENFDPNQITIEERPAVAVDEDNAKLLGRHKRKRVEGESERKKKKKEGRREKPKKLRKKKDSDDDFSGGEEIEGKRARKKKSFVEGDNRKERPKVEKRRVEEDEENLDPEEHEEIATMRKRMEEAAEADVLARQANPPRPAMHKLKMLPEVTALLNRNSRDVEAAIVDPENNLLLSVRYFLEPLTDGSLPAYNIQREIFSALAKLPIDKESLISSGLGKVVAFYTKSKKPEISIKRAAERLVGEWSRPILKRSDDYRQRVLAEASYDPTSTRKAGGNSQISTQEAAAIVKARGYMAPGVKSNRARAEIENKTYTVVPKSTQIAGGAFARPLGASGEDAFRRMKMRQQMASGQKKAR